MSESVTIHHRSDGGWSVTVHRLDATFDTAPDGSISMTIQPRTPKSVDITVGTAQPETPKHP